MEKCPTLLAARRSYTPLLCCFWYEILYLSLHKQRQSDNAQIGSALCGAAQSMTWLIIARAVQGIGGGGERMLLFSAGRSSHTFPLGILQMVNIVIGDIVPLEKLVVCRRHHAHWIDTDGAV